MTDQKERLKKLYALALRGVGGEKVQAQAILEKLLKKYAISLEELDEQAVNEYHLEYYGKEQEKLLKQTIYKVTDDSSSFFNLCYTASGRKCKTTLGVRCTAAQKVEIEFLFDFYKRVWEKERELSAFYALGKQLLNARQNKRAIAPLFAELQKLVDTYENF